jgi:AcrR family transcriptional regulator
MKAPITGPRDLLYGNRIVISTVPVVGAVMPLLDVDQFAAVACHHCFASVKGAAMTTPARRYDSPARRRQQEETRERILDAATEIAREQVDWDWTGLTFRAVAERADVGERTVYRHFTTSEDLHSAVMQRLIAAAGVSYEDMTLEGVALLARRFFRALPRFTSRPQPSGGPAAQEADRRRREAVLRAVSAETDDRALARRAAAVLDVLSVPYAYERLVGTWGMSPRQAADTVAWVVEVVGRELREG